MLPLAFFASCSDDDDIAQVDFNVTVSGVTKYNGNFYTVAGNEVSVDDVSVKSLTDQAATVTAVRYFLNGVPIIPEYEDGEFTINFTTENLKAGTYSLGITATVLQVDKSINTAALSLPLVIVAEESELPSEAPEIGTYTTTLVMNNK